MRFRCMSDVRKTSAGEIELVEVRWNEQRIYVAEMLGTLSIALLLAACAAFGGLSWRGLDLHDPFLMWSGLVAVACCFAVASWCLTFAVEMKGCPRALTFLSNGTMRAPMGLATGRWHNDQSHLPHSDIVSVETREEPYTSRLYSGSNTWAVELHYRTGQIVTVAQKLTREGAERLDVTLRAALNDLRSASGNGAPGLTVGAEDEKV